MLIRFSSVLRYSNNTYLDLFRVAPRASFWNRKYDSVNKVCCNLKLMNKYDIYNFHNGRYPFYHYWKYEYQVYNYNVYCYFITINITLSSSSLRQTLGTFNLWVAGSNPAGVLNYLKYGYMYQLYDYNVHSLL
jgi:hypothetical protein